MRTDTPIATTALRVRALAARRVLHPLGHRLSTALLRGAREVLRMAYVGERDARRMGFWSFGERSMLEQPHAVLMGQEQIGIGDDTLISAGAMLAASPESDAVVDRDAPMIKIGSRVWAARGLSIVAHRRIEIGDDVWFGPSVYITDASHDADDPSLPIGHRMLPAEPVRIGNGSWLGTGVVVLPGVRIGDNTVVGANSVVAHDLPSNCVAVGAPARVVRELSASTRENARP